MDAPSSRSKIFGRILVAHAVGLWVAGMEGSIGTTAGFDFFSGALGLFLGGVISIPWIAVLAATIWFQGGVIERHPLLFAIIGPITVCTSYAMLASPFLDAVAISCVTSSLCYLGLVYFGRWRVPPRARTSVSEGS